jgi:5-methyltetrahydropteroyltriglutamate--homocysteine methyltransferase
MARPASVTIPTEPIGSIPRPADLIEKIANGDSEDASLDPLYENAIRDTIERFEATGSPVVTDGEQRKFLIEAQRDGSGWQPDGVTWLP